MSFLELSQTYILLYLAKIIHDDTFMEEISAKNDVFVKVFSPGHCVHLSLNLNFNFLCNICLGAFISLFLY